MKAVAWAGVAVLLTLSFLTTIAAADPAASVRYHERNGEVIALEATGRVDAATPFAIASIGKIFTSVAILKLVEAGTLTLHDPAADWLSEDIVEGFGGLDGITIRHLLSMRSGLPDYFDSYLLDFILSRDAGAAPITASQAVSFAFIYDDEALFEADEEFDYSNTNYVLLQLILEGVIDAEYPAALEALITQPAGLRPPTVFGYQPLPTGFPDGHEDDEHIRGYYTGRGYGDGGLLMSAQDLAAFYRALLIERRILSAEMLNALLDDPEGDGYGLGIVIDEDEGLYGHSGGDLGFASDVVINAETGEIALTFVAEGDGDTDWAYEQLVD